MSSFFFSAYPDPVSDHSWIGPQLSFTTNTWEKAFRDPHYYAVCTRVDQEHLWAPCHDRTTGTLVMIAGRPALEATEWREAMKENGGSGSVVAGEILRRYQRSGVDALTSLNGGFSILIWDGLTREVILCTDRLGIMPVYALRSQGSTSLALSTHPDILARACCKGWQLDLVTVAEQLQCGQGVHPYSFYTDVLQLDSGTVYRWRQGDQRPRKKVYWSPEPTSQEVRDFGEFAEEFAEILHGAVERRTHSFLGPVAVFLSGGSDSRVPLFATSNREGLSAITLFDDNNQELIISRRLAERAEARHLLFKRDIDYYPRAAADVMRIAGGMWNYADGHYHGILDQISDEGFGTILSGCYADYMFKGLLLNRRRRKVLGRMSPVYSMAPFAKQFYLTHKAIAPEWKRRVEARLDEVYENLVIPPRNDTDWQAIEIRRLIPVSREGDFAARSVPWRTMPWDHYLCDKDLLDFFLRIPVSLKLNGSLYGEAVALLSGLARDIQNGNTGVSVNASNIRKIYSAAILPWLREGLGLGRNEPGRVAHASNSLWPNWRYITAHSAVLRDSWVSVDRESRAVVGEILGWDPWGRSLADWGKRDPELFSRIWSFCLWYRGVREGQG